MIFKVIVNIYEPTKTFAFSEIDIKLLSEVVNAN